MDKINWGIIGCGDVTEKKSGPGFNKAPNSALRAVMRRDAAKAADYAIRQGVEKWTTDAVALINDAEIDAIYIATPPLNHEEYTLAAINAGKPVYVEKPMTLDTAAAERMAEAAAHSGVRLTVAHYRRELEIFKKVKELIDQKAIGDVRYVNLQMLQPYESAIITQTDDNWRVNPEISGGGLFHDLAPHQLDLMLHFFGKPRKYSGFSGNQGGYYPADDIVAGDILFANGVIFKGLWCFSVPKEETKDLVEIVGSEGKIEFSVFGTDFLILHKGGEQQRIEFNMPEHIQQPMIEEVVKYFRAERDNPCPPEDGVEVMRIIDSFTRKD